MAIFSPIWQKIEYFFTPSPHPSFVVWTGEVTEASIFPFYAQYQIRSQTGQTYKIKMSYQTSILDLPAEMKFFCWNKAYRRLFFLDRS